MTDSVCVLPFIFKLACIRCKNTLREGFTDGTFLKNNKPTWRSEFGADFRFFFFMLCRCDSHGCSIRRTTGTVGKLL